MKTLTYTLASSWTTGTTAVIWQIWGDPILAEPIASGEETLRHEESTEIRDQLLAACVARLEEIHGAKYRPSMNVELPDDASLGQYLDTIGNI